MIPKPIHPVVVFDFDDTIAVTRSAWTFAKEELARACRAPAGDRSVLESLNGLSARDMVARIHQKFTPDLPLMSARALFDQALLNHYQRAGLSLKPGAFALLENLRGRCRMAVASGSSLKVLSWALARLTIGNHFDLMVSSEEVSEGKPSPLVFLEAARRMNTVPRECLVFEDSLIGVQAAKLAGMNCIAVPSRDEEWVQIASLADACLASLDECDLAFVTKVHADKMPDASV